MNTCIKCGSDYEYDSAKPLGSSSVMCASCRKKNTIENKKAEQLWKIIPNPRCFKCGHTKTCALKPIPSVAAIDKSEVDISSCFILCLNCEAEVKSGDIYTRVTNSKSRPVGVSFYQTRVTVLVQELPASVSCDVIDVDVVNPSASDTVLKDATPTKKKLEQ